MDDFAIRPARRDDAGAIADVYLASFQSTYDFPLIHTDDQVRRWIADVVVPTEEVWVALGAESPAGESAAAESHAGESAASGGAPAVVGFLALTSDMVDQLYVAPGWTGRGIGSCLLTQAKARRPNGLDLYTFQVNAGARRFYERHGFAEIDRGDGSGNEEGQPDLRYAWRP